jgi:microcompartment protein CcmK/EutM
MKYTSLKRLAYGKGKADTTYSLSTIKGKKLLIDEVVVSYSGNPTHAGVAIALDSGLGADYDATLLTGSANARHTIYPVDLKTPFILLEDDALLVTAPAGGGVLTATISIIGREL